MPTPNSTYRPIIMALARKSQRPLLVSEIYDLVQAQVQLDDGDLLPVAGDPSGRPVWQRNVRHALQTLGDSGELANVVHEQWRLPSPDPAMLVDPHTVWTDIRVSADESRQANEVFASTQRGQRYRIIRVGEDEIEVDRLDANAVETVTRADVERAARKINATGGRTGRRTLNRTVAKEVTIVHLHPRLTWSADGNFIEVRPLEQGAAPWTAEDVTRLTLRYFGMLRQQVARDPFPAAEAADVANDGDRAGDGFARVSAVLADMGLPYLQRFEPAEAYEPLWYEVVETHLMDHPGLVEEIGDGGLDIDPGERLPAMDQIFAQPPPAPADNPRPNVARAQPRRIDFARRDAENHQLGLAGERYVVAVERERLRRANRPDLAEDVEHVTETRGDGLGYDVLSFDERDDTPLHIEVKTTNQGKDAPFFLTASEVVQSAALAPRYVLYRVYDFRNTRRIFRVSGPLEENCTLHTFSYVGRAGRVRP